MQPLTLTRGLAAMSSATRAVDRLLVRERRAGEGDREAVITQVRSEYGRPPCLVHWHDSSQSVFPAAADTLIAWDSGR